MKLPPAIVNDVVKMARAGVPNNDIRTRLLTAGFAPLPVKDKKPPIEEWQKRTTTTPDDLESWQKLYPNAKSTGVLTRLMPTLDADIKDQKAAEAIEAMVRERFEDRGCILVRIGNAPKRAIPFRTDTPFKKIVVNLVAPGGKPEDGEKIELLGNGQQVVVAGIHPDTKRPYEWFGGEPGEIKLEELPHISEAEAISVVDDAVKLLRDKYGYQLATTKPANNGDASENWSFLFDNIRRGVALHESLCVLAAKMVVAGTGGGAVINILRGWMETSDMAHDERWRERYDDIPRAVATAEEKFAPSHPATAVILESFFAEELEQQPVEPVDWSVEDFIPSDAVTGFFGDGGTGKDLLLFMLGACAISGKPWLGKQVKASRVLYFPIEDNKKELRRRQAAIAEHYGICFADFSRQFKITPLVGRDTVLAAFDQKSGLVKPTPLTARSEKILKISSLRW